ncbi:AAA family ATPase [Wolbachia endosymbiont of Psylliodes chrysocephala]|uniref:AAA family ATPase n=1 Tax=Wolbachia endosymbiont of Psylliodes chrysocephala TaxID=2883236 RepID=UPI0020A0076D|nr:AAA family ATPase [Wolbachia endosymbiont of Psylliodes chrysocephala]
MIIVVGGQKGGSGKTTIATNITTMRVMENRNVLLYDIDPQRTATLWVSRRREDQSLPGISISREVLRKQTIDVGIVIINQLQALQSKYQDIIVDVGGANNQALRAALSMADLAIFPVIPSAFDMWTIETLSDLVTGAQKCKKNFNAKVLLNKVNTNPVTAKKQIEDCDDFLSDFNNLIRFNNFLSERITVQRASNEGMATVEYRPADLKATEEIKSVYKEVLSVRVTA